MRDKNYHNRNIYQTKWEKIVQEMDAAQYIYNFLLFCALLQASNHSTKDFRKN